MIGRSRNPDTHDYAITGDSYESVTKPATLDVKTNTGKIKIYKTDFETADPIEGVNFELIDSNGKTIQQGKTDAKGELIFEGLNMGNYQLKELFTDENDGPSEILHAVEVEYNKTTTKHITNNYKKGKLVAYKVEKDHPEIVIHNVSFDLFDKQQNKIIGTYTTNDMGELIIPELCIGSYKLIEKSTNQWYEPAPDTEFQITGGKTTKIMLESELKKGQIKITKTDKEDDTIKLSNVTFEVLDKNNQILETITTNQKGEATTQKYPIKDYEILKLREVKTDEKYILDSEEAVIELKANKVIEVNFTNMKKRGQIEIIKISADDNQITGEKKGTLLAGAVFEIYDENNKLVDTITTQKNGKATSKLLETGKYSIQEKSAGSKNYIVNNKKYFATIKEDGQIASITVENNSAKPAQNKLPKTGF